MIISALKHLEHSNHMLVSKLNAIFQMIFFVMEVFKRAMGCEHFKIDRMYNYYIPYFFNR